MGRNESDRDYGPLVIRLKKPAASATAFHLDVLGKAGRGSLLITCGERRYTIPFADVKAGKRVTTRLSQPVGKQPVTLQAIPSDPGGVAYVVFRTITLESR